MFNNIHTYKSYNTEITKKTQFSNPKLNNFIFFVYVLNNYNKLANFIFYLIKDKVVFYNIFYLYLLNNTFSNDILYILLLSIFIINKMYLCTYWIRRNPIFIMQLLLLFCKITDCKYIPYRGALKKI